MGTYILRRLLLMIPTLIGITFLVFMLIALSPGGIGASLRVSGGQMDQSSAAEKKAYLEDRYGLDDPAPIQYIRWLGRISPLKFGIRDQVDPRGERITFPKDVKKPPLHRWFTDALPVADEAAYEWPEATWQTEGRTVDEIIDQKNKIFRGATNTYAKARAAYIKTSADLESVAANYARSAGLQRMINADGTLRAEALARQEPDRTNEHWSELEQAGAAQLEAYRAAVEARAHKVAVFLARPYPEAGIGVGPVSLAAPDFGVSFSKSRPVSDLVREALPVTLMINLIAFPIVYIVAIPCGMLAAIRRGSLFDVGSGSLFIALLSFPIVLAGVLAIGYLANKENLGWFPVSGLHDSQADAFTWLPFTDPITREWHRGYVLDTLWHVALPVMCLVYGGFAVLAKQTRAAMLDNFNADYVRTAKAKGVAFKDVIFRHVFRNSLLPLITIFVTIFPAMLSGSVVIEKIFTVPGMGSLVLDAINNRDRELLLATTLMIASVNLIALLLADILYAVADPRISYS